ncbi:heparin lyase I family protein [Ekhidna sp. To15]|uniref:heparin lyase I family protein n=1 Tax=Ekhidna sp. To15 TaxID=3395267 RepID=UPI003F51C56A
MKKISTLPLLLILTNILTAQQAYFYDQFDYIEISNLENDSIWSSHFLNHVDISENDTIDDWEKFKQIEFCTDPVDSNNKVAKLTIERVSSEYFNSYRWDGPNSSCGPLTEFELSNRIDSVVNDTTYYSSTYDEGLDLYCGVQMPGRFHPDSSICQTSKYYINQMKRIELKTTDHNYQNDIEYWFSWKMFLDTDYELDSSQNNEILTQFHIPGSCNANNPPISLQIIDSTWILRIDQLGGLEKEISPVSKNEWTTWKINFLLSEDNEGFIKLWKNGTIKFDTANVITANCSENFNFKLGLYKSNWWNCQTNTTSKDKLKVLYIDDVWAYSDDLDASGGFPLSLKPQDQNDTINVSDMEVSTYDIPGYENSYKFKFVKKGYPDSVRYVYPSTRTVDLYKQSDYLVEDTLYYVLVRIPDHPIFNEYGLASEIYIDDLELELKTQYQNETFEITDSVATYGLGEDNVEYEFKLKEVGNLSNEKFYSSNTRFLPLDSIQSWLDHSMQIQVEVQAKGHKTFAGYGPKQYFYFDDGSGARVSNEIPLNIEEEPIHFQIFPNPTEGVITINYSLEGEIPVRLMDLTGRMLMTAVVDSFPINLNLAEFKKGTYILKLGDHYTRKIILNK